MLFVASCKKPTENVDINIETGSLVKAPLLIRFQNADASVNEDINDFTVKITGRDSALVEMDGGGNSFKVSHGMLPLNLNRNANISKENPITFTITATPNGFVPVSQTVVIKADEIKIIPIDLISYAKPPEGTSVLIKNTALNAGVSNETTLEILPSASLSQRAKLHIPQGTQMLDENGDIIDASSMKSSIVQFGTNTPSLVNSFPGRQYSQNTLDEDGNLIRNGVNFVTAGMLAINMTAGNKQVKRFSKPVDMEIELPNNLENFEKGVAVKEGDVIPLWSYNENNGVWKAERTAEVIRENGKLVAKAKINHLSYWNLDWGWGYFGSNSTLYKNLDINLIPSAADWKGAYEVQLQNENGGYLAGFHYYQPHVDFFEKRIAYTYQYWWYGRYYSWTSWYNTKILGKYGYSLTEVPNISKAKVVLYDLYKNYKKVAESPIFNPTTVNSVNVDVPLNIIPKDEVKVYFNVKSECSGKDLSAMPSGWFFLLDYTAYLEDRSWNYDFFYLYNGKLYSWGTNADSNGSADDKKVGGSLKMIAGHNYYMSTYNSGKWYQTQFDFAKKDFVLPEGSGLKGKMIYDAATKSMTFNGTFTLNCK